MLNKKEIELLIGEKKLIEGYVNMEKQLTPNGFDLTVSEVFRFTSDGSLDFTEFDNGQHPSLLNFEGGSLFYYSDGKVLRQVISGSIADATPLEGIEGSFYSMQVSNGALYATDPMDYASEGQLRVYDISSGALLETIEAGIVPGGVVFD